MLKEFHNPEDIAVLVRDVKYPIKILDTARPTSLLTEDKKDPITVMIQTEETKQYVQQGSIL